HRAGNPQLETLPAHVFDQYRQVQLTAPGDNELFRAVPLHHPQRHVVNQLLLQAVADIAGGDKLAVLAGKGRVVDLEGHAHRGFVHGEGRQGLDKLRVAQGIGNFQAVDTGDTDDIASLGIVHRHPLQAVVTHHLEDACAARLAVDIQDNHLVIALQLAPGDAADTDNTDIAVVVEGADLHLERAFRIHLG